MELITRWEVFNTASLAFCQFQGMIGIIIITGFVIFKHNLGESLWPLKENSSNPCSKFCVTEGNEVKQNKNLVNRQIGIRFNEKNKRHINGEEIIMKYLPMRKHLTIAVVALWMLAIPMAALAFAETAYVLGGWIACSGGLCGTEFGLVKHVIGGDSTFFEIHDENPHAMGQYRGYYPSGAFGLQTVVSYAPWQVGPNCYGVTGPIQFKKHASGNFDILQTSENLLADFELDYNTCLMHLEVDQSKKLLYVLIDANKLFVLDADTLEKLTDEPITLGFYGLPGDIALDEKNDMLWVAIGRTSKAYDTNTWLWVDTVVFDSLGADANSNAIAVDGENGYVWAMVEDSLESVLCREDINSGDEETFDPTLCADEATHLAVDPQHPSDLYGLMEGGEFWRIAGAEVDGNSAYPSCDWIDDLGGPMLVEQIDMFIEKPLVYRVYPIHHLVEDPFQHATPITQIRR